MTMAIRLLCRVVRRRMEQGEELEAVLTDYPKLTEAEKSEVRQACGM